MINIHISLKLNHIFKVNGGQKKGSDISISLHTNQHDGFANISCNVLIEPHPKLF